MPADIRALVCQPAWNSALGAETDHDRPSRPVHEGRYRDVGTEARVMACVAWPVRMAVGLESWACFQEEARLQSGPGKNAPISGGNRAVRKGASNSQKYAHFFFVI